MSKCNQTGLTPDQLEKIWELTDKIAIRAAEFGRLRLKVFHIYNDTGLLQMSMSNDLFVKTYEEHTIVGRYSNRLLTAHMWTAYDQCQIASKRLKSYLKSIQLEIPQKIVTERAAQIKTTSVLKSLAAKLATKSQTSITLKDTPAHDSDSSVVEVPVGSNAESGADGRNDAARASDF